MGSPKRQRKKFSKPAHPWQKERILAEKELLKSYGLKRKYEIWKMNTILKKFTSQAKNLITAKKQQSDKERSQLIKKLFSLGLIDKDAKIEDVLSLALKNVMERRLQTIVYRKNIARSLDQSRQFIVHEHISVGDKTITAPSYLVSLNEENIIQFAQGSAFVDSNHPERLIDNKEKKPKKTKETEIKESKKEQKKKTEIKEKPKEQKAKENSIEEKKETKKEEEK